MASNLKELEAELAKLKAENEALKSAKADTNTIVVKITDGHVSATTGKPTSKGAISLYRLQRFPITLYVSQYDQLRKVLNGDVKVLFDGKATTFPEFVTSAIAANKLSLTKGE